jgi:hypothetical protein
VLVLLVAATQAPAHLADSKSFPARQAGASSGCDDVSLQDGSQQMDAYSAAGAYSTVQEDGPGGVPARVSVLIPPIQFTGPGTSATLPVGPCQHIYRYRFENVHTSGGETPSPFRYLEVDWNTEGLPRGPNDSFSSPHFDFHFYLRPRRVVDETTTCTSSNGITCDPFLTGYAQMGRFLRLPKPRFIPASYAPDVGSSIPLMGLHLLNRNFEYTVDNVDHYPTLIYGTFHGKVFFAEASVTLATLQDAIAAPDQEISFRFLQPRTVQGGLPWPRRFVIRYLPGSGEFSAGFERFRAG